MPSVHSWPLRSRSFEGAGPPFLGCSSPSGSIGGRSQAKSARQPAASMPLPRSDNDVRSVFTDRTKPSVPSTPTFLSSASRCSIRSSSSWRSRSLNRPRSTTPPPPLSFAQASPLVSPSLPFVSPPQLSGSSSESSTTTATPPPAALRSSARASPWKLRFTSAASRPCASASAFPRSTSPRRRPPTPRSSRAMMASCAGVRPVGTQLPRSRDAEPLSTSPQGKPLTPVRSSVATPLRPNSTRLAPRTLALSSESCAARPRSTSSRKKASLRRASTLASMASTMSALYRASSLKSSGSILA
mmetsp:Transcript_57695/g.151831  ORF Transcript_57695/g.151831 Transcript_57695/m.151831 type:complete len:300 (-) Transcript_57695:129-1028(-)